jgi:hypothetical protein
MQVDRNVRIHAAAADLSQVRQALCESQAIALLQQRPARRPFRRPRPHVVVACVSIAFAEDVGDEVSAWLS